MVDWGCGEDVVVGFRNNKLRKKPVIPAGMSRARIAKTMDS